MAHATPEPENPYASPWAETPRVATRPDGRPPFKRLMVGLLIPPPVFAVAATLSLHTIGWFEPLGIRIAPLPLHEAVLRFFALLALGSIASLVLGVPIVLTLWGLRRARPAAVMFVGTLAAVAILVAPLTAPEPEFSAYGGLSATGVTVACFSMVLSLPIVAATISYAWWVHHVGATQAVGVATAPHADHHGTPRGPRA